MYSTSDEILGKGPNLAGGAQRSPITAHAYYYDYVIRED